MYQSPEGATPDSQLRTRVRLAGNHGHVSIPRRGHARFPGERPSPKRERASCINPPKGPRPIPRSRTEDRFGGPAAVYQSPEGATPDSQADIETLPCPNPECVSIPRRGHARFPVVDELWSSRPTPQSINPPKGPRPIPSFGESDCTKVVTEVSIPRRGHARFPDDLYAIGIHHRSNVSIPRRGHARFPDTMSRNALLTLTLYQSPEGATPDSQSSRLPTGRCSSRCINPPKGPRPISSLCKSLADVLAKGYQSPEGATPDFQR